MEQTNDGIIVVTFAMAEGSNEWSDKPEPVLLNVYGDPALIPRNEFRQPM
jgi:hypothetical protein